MGKWEKGKCQNQRMMKILFLIQKLKIPFEETRKIEKKKEIKTYDFAGETIEVDESTGLENSVKVNQYQKRNHIPLRRKVSGLDLILSGKKPKMSVMKKSKMDWEAHRKKDNLEEELNNVKNSKKSIVDKNDFLLRTDHRTFELEREERLKRINNRKNN